MAMVKHRGAGVGKRFRREGAIGGGFALVPLGRISRAPSGAVRKVSELGVASVGVDGPNCVDCLQRQALGTSSAGLCPLRLGVLA